MTGWEKVAAATAVALLGLIGLNLAIWRRIRAAHALATAERGPDEAN